MARLSGFTRTCTRFALKRVKKGKGYVSALRCTKYARRKGKPVCHPYKRHGGRSRGLLNRTRC